MRVEKNYVIYIIIMDWGKKNKNFFNLILNIVTVLIYINKYQLSFYSIDNMINLLIFLFMKM